MTKKFLKQQTYLLQKALYPLDESEESSSSDDDPMLGKLEVENHKIISKLITKNNLAINKITQDKQNKKIERQKASKQAIQSIYR